MDDAEISEARLREINRLRTLCREQGKALQSALGMLEVVVKEPGLPVNTLQKTQGVIDEINAFLS